MVSKTLKLTLFFYLLVSPILLAQGVTDVNGTSPVVSLNSNGKSFELFVTPAAGSQGSPFTLYLPIGTDGTGTSSSDNRPYSYYTNRSDLPLLSGGLPTATTSLIFRLVIDIEDGANELYVAVGKEGDYDVVKELSFTGDSSDYSLVLGLDEICNVSDDILDCSNLDKTKTPTSKLDRQLLIFVGSGLNTGSPVTDPGALSNALFYNFNLSNRIVTDEVLLFDLLKGDEQLTADFRATTMVDYRGLYGVVRNVGSGVCSSGVIDSSTNKTLQDISTSFSGLTDLKSLLTIGQVKVPDLSNDNCYGVRIVLCDFYGFCSTVSQELQNGPENIQTLLEKQACFFFTAGFGEKHYVVDYFQAWRDNFLSKFWLGREFISWYYSFAPQHTSYILQRPWLQSVIKGVAYVLYGVIKYWLLILFFVVLVVVQSRFKLLDLKKE